MRQYRRTTLIMVGCLSVLVGLGLARKISFDMSFWPLLLATPCLLLLKSKTFISLLLVVFLGLSLGLWRGSDYMNKLSEIKQFTGQKVTVEVTATSDAVYAQRSQLEFTANNVTFFQEPFLESKELAGKFKISGFGLPMVYRGDRISVTGKLYPMRGANQARIAYAQLQRVGNDNSWINSLTRRFSAGMQSALPEPNASFGLGLLIGQRSNLPDYTLVALSVVGLTHIIAVSGYNLTILVRSVSRVKKVFGSKFQRLVISLVLIGTFVLMTGFSASIVRAAIVSTLGLWAWYYGREIRPVLIILFTAALTGLYNPFYVWSDLGWYLSFLAFFGVLVLAPLLANRLWHRQPKVIGMVLLETLCAQIMVMPLIMMIFGKVSLIGILANLLVVPLVPFTMLFAAVAATAGMLIPAVASWIAWPANILLTYILDISNLLSGVPSALVYTTISLSAMLSLYALVVATALILHRHKTPKTAILTDRNNASASRLDVMQGAAEERSEAYGGIR